MSGYCDACGQVVLWRLVREYTDERGRRWEVYRCPACGQTRKYAVA